MKKGKERQKSRGAVLARILLCMMAVWMLTGCGSDRTHRRDVTREEEENYNLKDEEKDDTKDEGKIGEKEETESKISKEKEEKEKESRDLELMNLLCNALSCAIADAKVTGAGEITIRPEAVSLDQASADGSDSEKVLNAMKVSLGNEREVRLYSAVGSGQDIICYYDAKNNLIVTYVEQHDDSVGGSEEIGRASCRERVYTTV